MSLGEEVHAWHETYGYIYGILHDAQIRMGAAAGIVARDPSPANYDELKATFVKLSAAAESALLLPAIPDVEGEQLFRQGMTILGDASTSGITGAAARDIPTLVEARRLLAESTNCVQQSAAILTRNTGKPADPDNPYSSEAP